MGKRYIARRGDCISSIAFERGFFPGTIWNHPDNKALRALRVDPNVLFPGDEVVIPDRRQRSESRSTDARHVFRRRGVPEVLSLTLLRHGKPRRGVHYVLIIEERRSEGTTDDAGVLKAAIPPDARRSRLELPGTGEVYELELGTIAPVDELAGVQSRLRNLGFYHGPIDGALGAETARALRQFQESEPDLEPSGAPDPETLKALQRRSRG